MTRAERRQRVLRFIEDYTADNGYSPSLATIAAEFGHSTSGAQKDVDALIAAGQVEVVARNVSILAVTP